MTTKAHTTVLIALCLLALPTTASEWHGPGEAPCNGRCSVSWALDQLAGVVPDAALKQWRIYNRVGWPMQQLSVRDGDFIMAMGEYIDYAHMIVRPMQADLPHWIPARGWLAMVDGDAYLFMIIHACQNPAVIVRRNMVVQDLYNPPTNELSEPPAQHRPWPHQPRRYVSTHNVSVPGWVWLVAAVMIPILWRKRC